MIATKKLVLDITGADSVRELEQIQSLWSGYGSIGRYQLDSTEGKTVVVKEVKAPEIKEHPRGWAGEYSHQRKLKSYQVELEFYKNWQKILPSTCYTPKALGLISGVDKGSFLFVLEDLSTVGFEKNQGSGSLKEIQTCLKWLATFHATFLGEKPSGLWETGCYWHLDTRPEELEALKDLELKAVAREIDQLLKDATYQTIVHGDAKLANFCFSKDDSKVAAVDFQYIGGGPGVKDLVYFLGSCLSEEECEQSAEEFSEFYFYELGTKIKEHKPEIDSEAVIDEWKGLVPIAWADFHRFLKGWSPGHWKLNSYSKKIKAQVIANLGK